MKTYISFLTLAFSFFIIISFNSCNNSGGVITPLKILTSDIYFSKLKTSGGIVYEIYSSSSEGTNKQLVSNLGLLTSKCYQNKMIIGRFDSSTYYNNIYSSNLDGSGVVEIPRNGYYPVYISLSPDGNKILFACDVGNYICVVNSDGTNFNQISQNLLGAELSPTFSSDSKRIAFMESVSVSETYLSIINTDESNLIRIKDNLTKFYNSTICWSPDGDKLAFDNTDSFGKRSIFVINSDGTGYFNLTNSTHLDNSPDWSPDGTKIVYISNETSGVSDIAVINCDGTGKTKLTITSNIHEYFPKWSPDGKKILYHSTSSTASEPSLMVLDVNTGVNVLISDSTAIGFWNYNR